MEGMWSQQQLYFSSFNNFCNMHVKLFDLHPLVTIVSNSLSPTQVYTIYIYIKKYDIHITL